MKMPWRVKLISFGIIIGVLSIGLATLSHAADGSPPVVKKSTSLESQPRLTFRKLSSVPLHIAAVTKPSAIGKPVALPKNHLVVKSIGVDADIIDGPTMKSLNKGPWHIPGTSNPAKGGNMVIAGHRWLWRPPNPKSFFDIDKIKEGDEIRVTWEGTVYNYAVKKIFIVTPDRVDILNNTEDAKLTIFTCTPKFSTKYRLVVEAYPIGV